MCLDNYDGALHLAAKVQESSNLDERENEQQQSRIRKIAIDMFLHTVRVTKVVVIKFCCHTVKTPHLFVELILLAQTLGSFMHIEVKALHQQETC